MEFRPSAVKIQRAVFPHRLQYGQTSFYRQKGCNNKHFFASHLYSLWSEQDFAIVVANRCCSTHLTHSHTYNATPVRATLLALKWNKIWFAENELNQKEICALFGISPFP